MVLSELSESDWPFGVPREREKGSSSGQTPEEFCLQRFSLNTVTGCREYYILLQAIIRCAQMENGDIETLLVLG